MRNCVWRAVVAVLVVTVFGPVSTVFGQARPGPTLLPPKKVLSLHRPTAEWEVVTTIVLAIESNANGAERMFKWADPKKGELACDGQDVTVHEVKKPAGTSSITCTYQPKVGETGPDSFTYTAQFGSDGYVPEATVPIEIRERGFRWEFKSNAATVTSDAPDPEALSKIPDIIGGTAQDFLITVNWQTLRPRRLLESAREAKTRTQSGPPEAPKPEGSTREPRRLMRQSDLRTAPGMASRSANLLVETGVQTDPVAATVVDLGPAATTPATGQPAADETTQETAARRNMVFRGEFNYNASFNAEGVGRFAEFGALGRGSFSTVLDSNESFKDAVGRVLQVIPRDRSAYKVDGALRFAVKQAHEMDNTTLVRNGQIERPSNIENMLLVEFGYRYDSAAESLAATEKGDARHRIVLRAELSPELTILPGHQLPTIGIEITKSPAGGRPTFKVTYGMNLSGSKGIFK